jgi:hypothetical protein
MNTGGENATILLVLYLIFTFVVIACIVVLIRWLFRINEIVTLLKNIFSAIQEQNLISSTPRDQNLISTDLPPLQLCEGCHRNFEKICLRKIASGQLLCAECINALKKKK